MKILVLVLAIAAFPVGGLGQEPVTGNKGKHFEANGKENEVEAILRKALAEFAIATGRQSASIYAADGGVSIRRQNDQTTVAFDIQARTPHEGKKWLPQRTLSISGGKEPRVSLGIKTRIDEQYDYDLLFVDASLEKAGERIRLNTWKPDGMAEGWGQNNHYVVTRKKLSMEQALKLIDSRLKELKSAITKDQRRVYELIKPALNKFDSHPATQKILENIFANSNDENAALDKRAKDAYLAIEQALQLARKTSDDKLIESDSKYRYVTLTAPREIEGVQSPGLSLTVRHLDPKTASVLDDTILIIFELDITVNEVKRLSRKDADVGKIMIAWDSNPRKKLAVDVDTQVYSRLFDGKIPASVECDHEVVADLVRRIFEKEDLKFNDEQKEILDEIQPVLGLIEDKEFKSVLDSLYNLN